MRVPFYKVGGVYTYEGINIMNGQNSDSYITDELIEDVRRWAWDVSQDDDYYMDYAQDALLKIIRFQDRYDKLRSPNGASFRTWAKHVAVNAILDRIKSKGRELRRNQEWADGYYPEELVFEDDDPGCDPLWDEDEAEKIRPCYSLPLRENS